MIAFALLWTLLACGWLYGFRRAARLLRQRSPRRYIIYLFHGVPIAVPQGYIPEIRIDLS